MDRSKARKRWSWFLILIGLIAMFIGAIDPLEGSVIILPGSALVALGALVGKVPRRKLLYWAFGLTAFGIATMFVMSAFGGVGGNSGHSRWWLLVFLPYPVGWIIEVIGAILSLRKPAAATD